MRIVQDKIGKEHFLDLLLNDKDIEHVSEYMIPSMQVEIEGKIYNIGIRMDLPYSNE